MANELLRQPAQLAERLEVSEAIEAAVVFDAVALSLDEAMSHPGRLEPARYDVANLIETRTLAAAHDRTASAVYGASLKELDRDYTRTYADRGAQRS